MLTKDLRVGTNLGVLHVLWMLVNGTLLGQRGAIFPALTAIRLSDQETRRAWSAFRHGVWRTPDLLRVWREHVASLAGWQVRTYEGYRVKSVDVTGFWRPALKGCPSKHYHPAARRALPAVIVGIVAEVGELAGQRLALPHSIERVHPRDGSERGFRHLGKGRVPTPSPNPALRFCWLALALRLLNVWSRLRCWPRPS